MNKDKSIKIKDESKDDSRNDTFNIENKTINQNPIDMNSLIYNLQNEDEKYKRISRNFQWLYWILIPIYAAFFILNPDKEITLLDRVSGFCYVGSMLIFALYFRYMYKNYKNVDYAESTITMLKNVVKRYRIWNSKILWIVLALLVLDAGVSLRFWQGSEMVNPINEVIRFNIIYFILLSISISIGVGIWYVKHKPIRDKAIRFLKEIEN
jgi:hypothetical protein